MTSPVHGRGAGEGESVCLHAPRGPAALVCSARDLRTCNCEMIPLSLTLNHDVRTVCVTKDEITELAGRG